MNECRMVSIIIPVYNVYECLDYCLESVVNQTYKNLQIILVDDGSTDRSGEKCDEWAKRDNRILVFHKKNGGLSDARNFGLNYATGEYISFIDSDDFIYREFIEIILEGIIKHNSQIGVANMKTVYSYDLQNCEPSEYTINLYTAKEAMMDVLYEKIINTSACGKIFVASLLNDVRFPVGKLFEDLATIYKVIMKADRIISVNLDGYFYFQRSGSIVNSPLTYRHLDIFDAWNSIYKDLVLVDKDYEKPFASKKLDGLYGLLQKEEGDFINLNAIWREIKELRRMVIFDRNAKMRIRLEAMLSFLGRKVSTKVLKNYYKFK